LQAERVDAFFDLHGKPATRRLRAGSGAPRSSTYPRRTLQRRLAVWLGLRSDHVPRVGQAYLDALRIADVYAKFGDPSLDSDFVSTRIALTSAEISAAERRLGIGGDWIALAPGAARATKRWPATHFAALARGLAATGSRPVLIGGPMDRDAVSAVSSLAPAVLDLSGLGLRETAAVLSRCRSLVTGDSGLMHVSEAAGTPVVSLFGPTTHAFGFTPFLSRSRVLQLSLPCRPCDPHGLDACPLGHHACLDQLSPVAVLNALTHAPAPTWRTSISSSGKRSSKV